jgi:7-carboxy-7-deazaguanine synthase
MEKCDINSEYLFLSDDKVFYTIEGEGEYIGRPSVFMRLSMCNLTCIGFASEDSPNGCDSYVSWSIKNKMTFAEIFQLMEDNNYINHLAHGAILKITGGEPLIQQKQLIKFIRAFIERYKIVPRIDFETNATLMPDPVWRDEFNATFTTSPKLRSNGDPEDKTYKPEVLSWHAKNGSGFKFVINSDKDVEEIWQKYVQDSNSINVDRDRIWFMPCCGSREEHIQNAAAIAEYAKAMDVNFSPRLQLVIWDKALKV